MEIIILISKIKNKIKKFYMEKNINQLNSSNINDNKLISYCFGLFGIASLLAWNAIIAQIPFFSYYLNSLNPSVSFPLLNKLFNIPLQFILLIKKKLFPLKLQLIVSIIISIICLISLPCFVFLSETNKHLGMSATIMLVLIMGLINASLQNGFLSLTSHFPLDKIVFYSTGQGISGIIMALLELVVLFYVNTGNTDEDFKYGAFIFFGISVLILILVIFALIFLFNSDYGKYYLSNEKNNKEMIKETINNIINENSTNDNASTDENLSIKVYQMEKVNIIKPKIEIKQEKKYWFFELIHSVKDAIFLIWFNFFITFSVYPSVYIGQNLFSTGKFKTNIIILIFCFCNTFGRYVMKYFNPNKQLGYKIILGRAILVILLIFNHYCNIIIKVSTYATSIFLIINLVFLSGTNGFDSSLCFGLGPTLVKGEYKGKAGSAVSLFQVIGGVCGSSFAFVTQKIIRIISKYKE